MEPGQPSRTAIVTSLLRAAHARLDPIKLIDDPFGDVWLADARAIFEQRMRALDPDGDSGRPVIDNGAYANVIVRARVCEDALREAVARGVAQYVIVGAGFDSFAQRRPDWARALAVIEVDHPATQSLKLRQIGEARAAAHYIAADLGAEPLGEALKRSPYRADAPAFFAWLGVTMYLPREANLATFREIARVGARGSELVFTYSHIARFARAATPEQTRMREAVAAVGEPFVCGFDPETLAAELAECGLTLDEDFGVDELLARYDPEGRNGMRGDALGRVARASVGGAPSSPPGARRDETRPPRLDAPHPSHDFPCQPGRLPVTCPAKYKIEVGRESSQRWAKLRGANSRR